ncbi:Hypothetical protein ORPV_163, partial [Orpheovirus IHUMI-LCC2]
LVIISYNYIIYLLEIGDNKYIYVNFKQVLQLSNTETYYATQFLWNYLYTTNSVEIE